MNFPRLTSTEPTIVRPRSISIFTSMEAPNPNPGYEPAENSGNELLDGIDDPMQMLEKVDKPKPTSPPVERTFQCSCGKIYLSYSALYSHNKQKHDGAPMNLPSGRGGRSRGRPRKQNHDGVSRGKSKSDGRAAESELVEDNSFFRNRGLLGGPVNPRLG
jgi:hypothetical protein